MVEASEGMQELAAPVNCLASSFDIEWVVPVIVVETIRLFGGPTLRITDAVDGTSTANGANMTSLIKVDSGTLDINLIIPNVG